jgi:alkanesulfonate monooxygenase SsuD/methylene tetrahydromethanopterin reductase-like flavin-dependent oxidoreductase (luciferase family)
MLGGAGYCRVMKYGIHVPNFGGFGSARALAGLAAEAEQAGWDGFFIWDHVLFCEWDENEHVDPWVGLTAVAAATERIMLGPLVTALARRRPWELARQSVSLQNYSGGRLVLGVGLGDPVEWDFRYFGDDTDPVVRAEKLDEGLSILRGLWSGRKFSFSGRHYTLEPMTFLPAPDCPIPVWVGGSWPHRAPFRRAARFDGVVPLAGSRMLRSELLDAVAYVGNHRDPAVPPVDVVITGVSEPADAASLEAVADYEQLAAWWLEELSPLRFGLDWPALGEAWDTEALRRRVRAGPPRDGAAVNPL